MRKRRSLITPILSKRADTVNQKAGFVWGLYGEHNGLFTESGRYTNYRFERDSQLVPFIGYNPPPRVSCNLLKEVIRNNFRGKEQRMILSAPQGAVEG